MTAPIQPNGSRYTGQAATDHYNAHTLTRLR
jgi:hypothetical protein